MSIVVIDYGAGNLGSIRRAFEECGAEAIISDDPKDLQTSSHIVLPGVGSFKECMNNLQKGGWVEPIREEVLNNKIPFLGICLGMQLIASTGFEGGETAGLGLIPGQIKKMIPKDSTERIPHVGWNEVHLKEESPLFEGIPSGTDFYFVHSYCFVPDNEEHALTTTPYSDKTQFVSTVAHENIYGVQFHPEKSLPAGLVLLQNFVELG